MSHKLPPDVDRLLWEVAESQDPKAFDDFELRFPHLVLELGQRIKLVREFRGARSEAITTLRAPHFDYRDPSPAPISRFAWVGGGVVLAALGFAAFVVTRQITPPPTPPHENIVIVPQANPPELPKAPAPQPSPPSVAIATGSNGGSSTSIAKWEQRQDVKFPHEHLQTVLASVAYEGGLNIIFAPNTPNPTIAMEYHGMNSVEIIQDLGRKFGFSAMKNGPEDVLIVPARDPNAKDTPVAGQGFATNLDPQPTTEPEAADTPAKSPAHGRVSPKLPAMKPTGSAPQLPQ